MDEALRAAGTSPFIAGTSPGTAGGGSIGYGEATGLSNERNRQRNHQRGHERGHHRDGLSNQADGSSLGGGQSDAMRVLCKFLGIGRDGACGCESRHASEGEGMRLR
jgi:hypothetical protein